MNPETEPNIELHIHSNFVSNQNMIMSQVLQLSQIPPVDHNKGTTGGSRDAETMIDNSKRMSDL